MFPVLPSVNIQTEKLYSSVRKEIGATVWDLLRPATTHAPMTSKRARKGERVKEGGGVSDIWERVMKCVSHKMCSRQLN